MTVEKSSSETIGNEEDDFFFPSTMIVMHCILEDDVDRFLQCFEDGQLLFNNTVVVDGVNERDEDGKTPLDLAVSLGRVAMVRELVRQGADIQATNGNGYTALHYAAAWGQAKALKTLVEEFNADINVVNIYNERAREIAFRYNHMECVDFLDWAEAKSLLLSKVKSMQDILNDPEKHQGRLNKDDKVTITHACKEKTDWVEQTPSATTQDFILQKQDLENALTTVVIKISEQLPEKTGKK